MKKAKDVDEYIKSAPKEVRTKLKELRIAIKEAAPDAQEKIGYRNALLRIQGAPCLLRAREGTYSDYISPHL